MKDRGGAGRQRVMVLGVGVDAVTVTEAVTTVEGFVGAGGSHVVATPNPEIIWRAVRDLHLRQVLNRADLAVADGAGVVWACRLLGCPLPGRVTGIELLERLLALADRNGWRVFFLGAAPDVVEEAAKRVRARYPGLVMSGHHHGYFRPDEEEAVVAAIRKASPQLLFVGMGAPRQENWIDRHAAGLGVPVCMAVGGCFDVLGGRTRRAPVWMRRAGLEWLYRVSREPRRLRRLVALPLFAAAVLCQALRGTALRRFSSTHRGSDRR